MDEAGRATDVESQDRIRIVVIDDHPLVRMGLVEVLAEEPNFVVCGEAPTRAAALELVAEQNPHVAVVDLSLGGENGLELVADLAYIRPDVHILVLSSHDERLYADRALKAGALGYIMKDEAAGELLTAVRQVASGKMYVSAGTTERLLSSHGTSRRNTGQLPLDRLSDRERQVLDLIGQGAATREIAEQLGLSIKTIETHHTHIREKLGLRDAHEVIRLAATLKKDG